MMNRRQILTLFGMAPALNVPLKKAPDTGQPSRTLTMSGVAPNGGFSVGTTSTSASWTGMDSPLAFQSYLLWISTCARNSDYLRYPHNCTVKYDDTIHGKSPAASRPL